MYRNTDTKYSVQYINNQVEPDTYRASDYKPRVDKGNQRTITAKADNRMITITSWMFIRSSSSVMAPRLHGSGADTSYSKSSGTKSGSSERQQQGLSTKVLSKFHLTTEGITTVIICHDQIIMMLHNMHPGISP
jgi:hypothetical protein